MVNGEMRFSIGFFPVIGAKLRVDSLSDRCKYPGISNLNKFRINMLTIIRSGIRWFAMI